MADGGNPLETLRTMLDGGMALMADLLDDPLVGRWLDAFVAMPAADRGVVVDAVEREVKARRLSRATESTTGQAMHPNPNARLYLRAHGPEAQRSDLERDEMMLATIRALRVIHVIAETPEIHAEWRDATREALTHVDAETRAVVAGLLRETLGLVDEVDVTGTDRT